MGDEEPVAAAPAEPNPVVTFFSDAATKVADAAKAKADEVAAEIAAVPGKVGDAIVDKVDEVKTSVVEAPGKVADKLADKTLDQVYKAQSKADEAKQRLAEMKSRK